MLSFRKSDHPAGPKIDSILGQIWQRATTGAPIPTNASWHAWDLCHSLATDQDFQQELKYGKYARYAEGRTGPELFAVLQAVAEWGSTCDPQVKMAATDDDNEERRNALEKLITVAKNSHIEEEFTPKRPTALGPWAERITSLDVYGVLWLARGIGARECSAEGGIAKFHSRSLDCVQPLLDLVHGKPSFYKVGGRYVPFSRPASMCSDTAKDMDKDGEE